MNKNIFSNIIPDGFGVNVHFTGNPIDVDMISDAGFKIVRMDLFWKDIEKKRGKYDFKSTGYDQLTNALIKKGIRPYYILSYGNKLYEEKRSVVTKKGQDAFVRYVEKATSRYKNKGIIWEVWNEPNHSFYWETQPNYNEYASLVKNVSIKIKENDPSGIVVAPALSGVNHQSLKWLEEIFKRGTLDYIDAVSVHPYRGSNPETVANDYKTLRVLIDKYATKDIPIISGEWGYSTANGWLGKSVSEKQQAHYLVRMFLINLLYDVPISIWYDWKNDGTDSNNIEHNFGIRQNNITIPKEAYIAVNNLTYILSGYKLTERIYISDPNDFFLKFIDKKGNIVIVFWTVGNIHRISFSENKFRGRIVSMFGEHLSDLNDNNNRSIEITNSPKYLIVQ
ncbi:cellulase family glycosylhydrolase [Niallia sp. 01092]|uniref:cellulase family glycosylhydrolase n=1 Tax=Niallia sp. 01092 TaxID=3457759 RepID=UPI003FD24822